MKRNSTWKWELDAKAVVSVLRAIVRYLMVNLAIKFTWNHCMDVREVVIEFEDLDTF